MVSPQKAPKERGKSGRPRIEVSLDVIKACSVLQCTMEEMVHALAATGVTMDIRTLKRRMQEPAIRKIIDAGKAEGRISIRREMFRKMKLMNSAGVTMTVHLAKHHLGQTERSLVELSAQIDSRVEVSSARERVNRKLDALRERIARRVDGIAAAAGAAAAAQRVE